MGSDSRFFVLEHAAGSRHDTVFRVVGDTVGDALRCPHCGGIVGMLTWLPPYRGELTLFGQDFGDFVDGPGNALLVSERFAESIRAEQSTGLNGFHPVELARVRRKRKGSSAEAPGYLYVLPAYGSAAVDESRSEIRRAAPITCAYCRATGVSAIHGFALEPGSWNGDDVFRPRGLHGQVVVSERFANLVARYGLTNVKLTATEEFVWEPGG